jgi:hypothetical protein
VCALPDPVDQTQILAGTYANWQDPTSGGVYWCADSDTVWQYAGLRGRRIFSLACYPYCRPNVFAGTDIGLYMRIGDTTWTRLPVGGGFPWVYGSEFLICPFDTSVWLYSLRDTDFGGYLRLSRNSGNRWIYVVEAGDIGNLQWSSVSDRTFYYERDYGLYRADMTPDTITSMVLPFPQEVVGLAGHPQQPWIYIGGAYHVGRYDEITGDTMMVNLPSGVTHVYKIAYAEDGLLVRTYQGLYHVSDDLTDWQLLDDSLNTGPAQFLYASPDRCLSSAAGRIYISASPNAVSPPRPSLLTPTLSVYPNPSNGGFVVSYDRPAWLRVYDILGQEVYSQTVERPGSIWLDLPGLSSGIYFLKATNTTDSRKSSPAVKITLIK